MATYKESSFNADTYQSFRPSYPDSFYSKLLSYYHKTSPSNKQPPGKLLDVGCGTGIVTIPFSKHFTDSATGTDPSLTMITKAASQVTPTDTTTTFKVGKAEESHLTFPPNSIDILTAAECVHWVDSEKFLSSSHQVLKGKGGVLAYWLYVEPIFKSTKANEIILKYTYDEEYMGPFWDLGKPTWRNFINGTNELVLQDDRFENVQVVLFDQTGLFKDYTPLDSVSEGNSFTVYHDYYEGDTKDQILDIKKEMSFEQFMNYYSSFSALHNWYVAHPGKKGTDEDLLVLMRNELATELGWEDNTKLEVIWDTMYCFATKK